MQHAAAGRGMTSRTRPFRMRRALLRYQRRPATKSVKTPARAGRFSSASDGGQEASEISAISEEVFKVPLRSDSPADAKDVGRNAGRVEFHEIAPARPEVARSGQQLMRLIRAPAADAEFFGG